MSTIGKVALQADENDLVTLQCDRCKSRFKIDCAYLNNELKEDIYCPICGISGALNTFYPEEVVEEGKKIAMAQFEKMFADVFKSHESKYLTVKTNPVQPIDTNLNFRNTDYDMQLITVSCCNKKLALMPIDITAGFYCPYCGRIVK